MTQPRFANARSVRNALERARLRQTDRLVSGAARPRSKADLMSIEAEDILKSRVFEGRGVPRSAKPAPLLGAEPVDRRDHAAE